MSKDQRTKFSIAERTHDDDVADVYNLMVFIGEPFQRSTFTVMESSREETPRATGAGHVQVQQQQQQQHYSIRNVNPIVVNTVGIQQQQQQHYSHSAASVIVQNAAVISGGGTAALVTMNNSTPQQPGILLFIFIIIIQFYPNILIIHHMLEFI